MSQFAVLHPDLGIGGAERLIVDACKALKERGHHVTVYTGYHDKTRCFDETRDGTLRVVTVCQWMPRSIFGKCHALMAYIKMILIAIYVCIFSTHDIVLCDQVSACIPFLKLDLRNRSRIVFYCHFPDQLLTTRDTLPKKIYRKFIDTVEEWSMSSADVILVNSNFTKSVVRSTFPSLKHKNLTVLYPCVDESKFFNFLPDITRCNSTIKDIEEKKSEKYFLFLSLNRFEAKKEHETSLAALASMLDSKHDAKVHLIIAGGFDSRLQSCVSYRNKLHQITEKLNLTTNVTFVESPSDHEKMQLLHMSDAVIYTPKNEHFGIVPLEAMAMKRPLLVHESGGPLETCRNAAIMFKNCEDLAESMDQLYSRKELCELLGSRGMTDVEAKFCHRIFAENLDAYCHLKQDTRPSRSD